MSRAEELVESFQTVLNRNIQELTSQRTTVKYDIGDIANRLAVHPTHLSNVLKERTGKSPCDLFEDAYIEQAKHLLQHTDFQISEIAYRLGFKEATNFTKFFKRYASMTPTEYRRRKKS